MVFQTDMETHHRKNRNNIGLKKFMGRRILFSVPENNAVLKQAEAMRCLGWEIIITPNLGKVFRNSNIPFRTVDEFTGFEKEFPFPPTLHPEMEAALTLDMANRIDIVYDITYSLAEGNDVGGHTLLALAVKGNRIPVASEEDMDTIIDLLKNGIVPDEIRKTFISRALDKIISHYQSLKDDSGDYVSGNLFMELENGENPYQAPAYLYAASDGDALAIHKFQLLSANVPCFTNTADMDCVLHTMCLAAEAFKKAFGKIPFMAVSAKHGNPCGMAVDWNSSEKCIEKSLWGSPLAVWGGEFIVNFPIDDLLAEKLVSSPLREEKYNSPYWMLHVIAAPEYSEKALGVLSKGKSRKLFRNPALSKPCLNQNFQRRFVRGGFMKQPSFSYVPDFKDLSGISDISTLTDMIISWSVSFSSFHGGNEVALSSGGRLIGVGGGPSTLDAARIAVLRARDNGHEPKGSVFAADAFFPFTDAPEILHSGGCIAGSVPEGGGNDKLVKNYFAGKNVSVAYFPEQYRGFIRH